MVENNSITCGERLNDLPRLTQPQRYTLDTLTYLYGNYMCHL